MGKHGADTAITTKKLFAAAGLALGVGSLALFPGVGTAAADGHVIPDNSATWNCPVAAPASASNAKACSASGSAEGAQDVNEQRGEDVVPAVRSIDTSTEPPHISVPTQNNLPVASYPAAPQNMPISSWPGSGWGVNDRAST